MIKNKNFWLGIIIAVVLITAYKTAALNDKPKESPTPALTLWDLDYIPTHPAKSLDDFNLFFIHVNDTENAQPVPTKLSSYKGKPIILHFWATWCNPCVLELPHYDQFAKASKAVNIAVSTDTTSAQTVRAFCRSRGIQNVQLAVDQTGLLARQMSAASLPTTIFINGQGQEVGRIVGPISWNNREIAALIESHILSKA